MLEEGWVPDLACIDWNMPVMDGLQFVSVVRANPAWRSITLMMVTTESEHGQIVKALAAGAHEYVIKPFTADAIGDKLSLLGLMPAGVPAMSAPITHLLDGETVTAVAGEVWTALGGRGGVPPPGFGPVDPGISGPSSWVTVTGRGTASSS